MPKENAELLMNWAKKHLPNPPDWNPPATEDELTKLEETIGRTLPLDFRQFYLLHDGHEETSTGLIYGLPILSLSGIEEHWQMVAEIADTSKPSQFDKCMSGKKIKPIQASRGWIPFSEDCSGNFLGVDLDPDSEGHVGQVINFGSDEREKYVLAKSFTEFLGWIFEQLNSGNFEVAEGPYGTEFNTRNPPTSHFLESIKTMKR